MWDRRTSFLFARCCTMYTGCSTEEEYTFTSGITAGAVIFLRPRKKCISFAAFSASSRKSSSRARFRLRSSRTHPNSQDLGNSQAATVDSADSVAMSAATAASRPRYCTLTATCRPSCKRALCTCTHPFEYLYVRSFLHLFPHACIHSLICSFIPAFIHPFSSSVVNSFTQHMSSPGLGIYSPE